MNTISILYEGVVKKYPYFVNNKSFEEKIEQSINENENIDVIKYSNEFLNLLGIKKEDLDSLKILKIKRNNFFGNVSSWIWKKDVRTCLDPIFNRLITLIYKRCFNDFMQFHFKDFHKEFKLDELVKSELPGINIPKLNKCDTIVVMKSVLFYDKLISFMLILDEDETFFDIVNNKNCEIIISKKINYKKFFSLIKKEFLENKDNKEFIYVFKTLNFGKYYLNLLRNLIKNELFISYIEIKNSKYINRAFLEKIIDKAMLKYTNSME